VLFSAYPLEDVTASQLLQTLSIMIDLTKSQ
jgi:hypothetical protein